ncbi:MAG TPA: hypothetical protein VIW29_01010, partial [Polyangiaceae bacterium]
MQRARSLSPRRGRWTQRALLAVAMLARVLSLLVCFELSGLDRDLGELLVLSGQVEAHADDCAGDSPRDCPPGCSACHCNAGCALPPEPRASATLELAPDADAPSAFEVHRA